MYFWTSGSFLTPLTVLFYRTDWYGSSYSRSILLSSQNSTVTFWVEGKPMACLPPLVVFSGIQQGYLISPSPSNLAIRVILLKACQRFIGDFMDLNYAYDIVLWVITRLTTHVFCSFYIRNPIARLSRVFIHFHRCLRQIGKCERFCVTVGRGAATTWIAKFRSYFDNLGAKVIMPLFVRCCCVNVIPNPFVRTDAYAWPPKWTVQKWDVERWATWTPVCE